MEERHSDVVSEIQRERVLSEVVSVVFCDFDDFIPKDTPGSDPIKKK